MFRRNKRLQSKHEELGRELQTRQEMAVPDFDGRNWMMTSATTSCASCSSPAHPVLSTEARVALTLRLLGGLTTDEIARRVCSWFPEPTVAQRIVRAKRTLS